MMRGCLFGAVAFALLVASIPVRAVTAPLVLEANSPWTLSHDDNVCRLVRVFGQENEQVTLELRFYGGEDFQAIVSGKPVGTTGNYHKLKYRFEPDTDTIDVYPLVGTINGLPSVTFAASLRPAAEFRARTKMSEAEREHEDGKPVEPDFARESEVTAVTLSNAFLTPVVLETGSMRAPMDQARACTDELIGAWGFDAKAYHALSRRPSPVRARDWITYNDYPATMLHANRSDSVQVMVTVGPTGKPEKCTILSGQYLTFAQLVCNLTMKRANFSPALDANGKPTNSFWQTHVDFWTSE